MNEYMPLKRGFTIFEIVIGLAILVVAGSIVMPAFNVTITRYARNKFISSLDAVVAYAWLHAMQTGNTHRIIFKMKEKSIALEMDYYNDRDELIHELVPLYFSSSELIIPASCEIVQFYINGIDEISQHSADRTLEEIFFYVYARGHTQSVIINMIDEQGSHAYEMGLILNPFMMKYEVHDAFQTP